MTDSSNWPAPNVGGDSNPIATEPRAGFWIRFVANMCDGLMGALVGLVVALPFTIFANNGGSNDLANFVQTVASFLAISYWIGTAGGSPLRRKLGVIVLDQYDGSFIGFRRGAIRVMMSWVSGICLAVGYLWMLWDPNKQTWHDKVAKTVVVRR